MSYLIHLILHGHGPVWIDQQIITHYTDYTKVPYKQTMRQRCKICGTYRNLTM